MLFLQANDRLYRLRFLVWQAAGLRICGTVIKMVLQLAGFDSFTLSLISFLVLFPASIISGYAVKAFCKALKLRDFAKRVFITTFIIDILSAQVLAVMVEIK